MKYCHLLLRKKTNKTWHPWEIEKAIKDLIKLLKMKPLTDVVVKEGNAKMPGFSGMVMIQTSHITFHHFRREKIFWLDILSCKEFNKDKVKKYFNHE
jgi:S-adenosylmethionine/arginine decarboxylase-like enzyme